MAESEINISRPSSKRYDPVPLCVAMCRPIDIAMRQSLSPLVGEFRGRYGVTTAIEGLRRRWQHTAFALKAQPAMPKPGWLHRVYLCPPATMRLSRTVPLAVDVSDSPDARRKAYLFPSCHYRRLCPWCYCRMFVRKTYRKYAKLLLDPQPQPDYHLVEVHSELLFPASSTSAQYVVSCMPETLRRLRYRLCSQAWLGMIYLQTVEPAVEINGERCTDYWKLHHRMLVVISADSPDLVLKNRYNDPHLAWASRTAVRHTQITKRTLPRIVGNTFLYPKYWLDADLAEGTSQIMAAYGAACAGGRGNYIHTMPVGICRKPCKPLHTHI